jgi:hypothetical protein
MTRILFLLNVVLLLLSPFQADAAADARSKKTTARTIPAKALQSLVLVVAQDADGEILSKGSGFVFDKDKVATNLHVLKGADRGYVKTLSTGITYKIDRITGSDPDNDLCVFVIKGIEASSLPLGSASRVQIGDDIYVAGNPRGLEGTITKGIISSMRPERSLMQIDAAISPGSSGGPVINTKGEVIGIVKSTITSGQNLNFAIPVDALKKMKNVHNMPFSKELPVNIVGEWYLSDKEIRHIKGPAKTVKTIPVDEFGLQTNEKYDLRGNNIESHYSSSDIDIKITREYDEWGIPAKILTFKNGKLDESTILSKGTSGYGKAVFERLGRRKINTSDKMTTTTNQGNIKSEGFYNARALEYKSVGQIPKLGQRTCFYDYDANGSLTSGRCTSIIRGRESVQTCKYSYDYDSYGNWLKKYEQCDDKKRTLQEQRIISYYD